MRLCSRLFQQIALGHCGLFRLLCVGAIIKSTGNMSLPSPCLTSGSALAVESARKVICPLETNQDGDKKEIPNPPIDESVSAPIGEKRKVARSSQFQYRSGLPINGLAEMASPLRKNFKTPVVNLSPSVFTPLIDVCQQISSNYPLENIVNSMSVFEKIADANRAFAGSVLSDAFKSAQVISGLWANTVASIPEFKLDGLSSAFAPFRERLHLYEVMDKANWPLFLVDCDEMCEELGSLDPGSPDLLDTVSLTAFSYLDDSWLSSVEARWSNYEELPIGIRDLIRKSIRYHRHGCYDATVALLMTLVEGWTEIYLGSAFSISEAEDAELFDILATDRGLKPLCERKKSVLRNQKDLFLAMMINADTGSLACEKIIRYIVDVVLANKYDEKLAAHNPLRNKVCHGVQTNYGTKEHSLKAILVTDLMIRIGRAARAGLEYRDEEEEMPVL